MWCTAGMALLTATGTVLAMITCRLTDDRRWGWLAAALGVMGAADTLMTVRDLGPGPDDPVDVGVRVLTALALAVAGVRATRSPRGGRRVRSMIRIGAVTVGAGAAVPLVGQSVRLPIPSPLADTPLLAGLVIVVSGLAALNGGVLRTADERMRESREQLRLARHELDRLARRDHQVQVALVGVGGATLALLGPAFADSERVRAAASAELDRLGVLLRPDPPVRGD